VIRAGDFIGGSGTWLDMAITKSLDQGRVTRMGPDKLVHAWAYLPDLADVFVRVAEQRSALPRFQVLHYPGISASGSELHAALEAVTGRTLESKALPWWLFHILALFSPMLRAVLPMRYLWQRPHRLVGTRLEELIGHLPASSLQAALAASLGQSPASSLLVP
jgi:nucleoside-diphosphate-sugar epimerase